MPWVLLVAWQASQSCPGSITVASPSRDNRAMVVLGSVVLGAEDVARAAEFYRRALGYVDRYDVEPTWASLRAPDGSGPNLSIMLSTTPVQDEPRVHLDLYADDTESQATEVERLVSLGARLVDWPHYPPDADFVVLADTEGNRFCVIDTSKH